ncbi:dihydroneopterin aldolase [Brevundimonas variabilis]|uniref:Dihydroneopterin aldolase n=1 Tax=Brevundimonas variabilis TaxID=74312 RepID=A0A7W9CM32_9CAUL|nr:dihydroneopterin aldolase [Brevundimonas variabilis]MBB5747692.1 dihydroneopterin aldolase [Brevundimonas variabilis]
MHSQIELRDLVLDVEIGTYGPGDVVPERHLLDLTLTIDASLVFIPEDGMGAVFDYDPLIARIDQIARATRFETQERLITLIVEACAGYLAIEAVEVSLRKTPVLAGTGTLGVRLVLDGEGLARVRRDQRA